MYESCLLLVFLRKRFLCSRFFFNNHTFSLLGLVKYQLAALKFYHHIVQWLHLMTKNEGLNQKKSYKSTCIQHLLIKSTYLLINVVIVKLDLNKKGFLKIRQLYYNLLSTNCLLNSFLFFDTNLSNQKEQSLRSNVK